MHKLNNLNRSLYLLAPLLILLCCVCFAQVLNKEMTVEGQYYEGDEISIVVDAPMETDQVTAVVTTKVKVDLVYNEKTGKWEARWRIPAELVAGKHAFKVQVVDFEGNMVETKPKEFVLVKREVTPEVPVAAVTKEAVVAQKPAEVAPPAQPVEPVEKISERPTWVAPAAQPVAPVEKVAEKPAEGVTLAQPVAPAEKVAEKPAEVAPAAQPVVPVEKVAEKPAEKITGEVGMGGPKEILPIPTAAKPAPEVAPKGPEKLVAVVPKAEGVRPAGNRVSTYNLLNEFQTFVKTLEVSGTAGNGIAEVRINGTLIPVGSDGRFEVKIPLHYGKNTIKLEAVTNRGDIVVSKAYKMLRFLAQAEEFNYTSREELFKMPVDIRSALTLFGIYLNKYVDLHGNLKRADAAKVMVSLYDYNVPVVEEDVFIDVPKDHEAAPYIKACKNRKIFVGYPDGKFRPSKPMSIAEAAAILCSTENLHSKKTSGKQWLFFAAKKPEKPEFWAKQNIAIVKSQKYMEFPREADTTYYRKPITVESIIKSLNRSAKMKMKQNELLDWGTGY